jgi:hypothetical protein
LINLWNRTFRSWFGLWPGTRWFDLGILSFNLAEPRKLRTQPHKFRFIRLGNLARLFLFRCKALVLCANCLCLGDLVAESACFSFQPRDRFLLRDNHRRQSAKDYQTASQ